MISLHQIGEKGFILISPSPKNLSKKTISSAKYYQKNKGKILKKAKMKRIAKKYDKKLEDCLDLFSQFNL